MYQFLCNLPHNYIDFSTIFSIHFLLVLDNVLELFYYTITF